MTELFSNIEFARPLYFWLLLALPLLWLRYRDRPLAVLLGRTILLALLVVILADPQNASEQAVHEERVFAYDISRSMPPGLRGWLESSTETLTPGPGDRMLVFGADTVQVPSLNEVLNPSAVQSLVQPEKTNLENLLTMLLSQPSAPRRVYLFTDGWETQGEVERLLPAAAAAGIRIFPLVPEQRPAIANVAVTRLLAPTQGDRGQSLTLKVIVDNQNEAAVTGTLTLQRNGQSIKVDKVNLVPGSQTFTYQTDPPEGGLAAFQATFAATDPERDLYPADSQATAWVSVRAKAKVMLINGQTGGGRYLEEILKRHGFEVAAHTPQSAPPPAGHKLVIFNNAERDRFPPDYFAAVERHVAEGNSFLMLGAEASFSPSSFRNTVIEKILPVEPREPPKRPEQNRAVVLVMDKSGSMREDNRMLYAKEAAKAVARQLREIDLLGVVGFDDSAFVVVYLETMARLRGVIDNQIDRLRPGGQTYFLPALLEAKRQLERANAPRKHIILFSDGITRGSQGELIDLVTAMRRDLNITVSAIAISDEADVSVMKRISQYGGGLFHHILDPRTLPRIALEQLQDKQLEESRDDRPLVPIPGAASQLLAGFAVRNYPAVLGYMETELKRGAQLDLLLQRGERRAPLLASWNYGSGKVAAFAADMEGRWTKNWVPWAALQGFWGKVFEGLSPQQESQDIPVHEARVNLAANRSVLDLFVYEEASADSRFRFAVTGKGAKSEGALNRLAPGHYQADLPISLAGSYRIDIVEDRKGRKLPYPPVGYSLPFDNRSESPRTEFNLRLLNRIAEATGGEINPRRFEEVAVTDTVKTYQPARHPLIILIFALLLLEILARRFLFNEPH
jgi:Ca-activated chloride channel homolog